MCEEKEREDTYMRAKRERDNSISGQRDTQTKKKERGKENKIKRGLRRMKRMINEKKRIKGR